MKTTTLLATLAVSFAASGAALAQEATYEYPQPAVSQTTRAQVQAELFAARADGSIKVWSTQYNPLTVARSEKSREQVRSELRFDPTASVAYTGEDSGSFALSRQLQQSSGGSVFARSAR